MIARSGLQQRPLSILKSMPCERGLDMCVWAAKDRLCGIHRARSATSRVHEDVPLQIRIEPDALMASLVCHKCQRRPCHGGSTFPIAQLCPGTRLHTLTSLLSLSSMFSMCAIQPCIVYSHPYRSYRSLSPTGSFIGGRGSQALCSLRRGVRVLVGHIASCRRICTLRAAVH